MSKIILNNPVSSNHYFGDIKSHNIIQIYVICYFT